MGQDPAGVAPPGDFTFLDQVQGRLARLGLDADVLSALLDLEGLRRQPRRLSATTRVWALVRTAQLTKACPDWREEARRVRGCFVGRGGPAAWWNASTACADAANAAPGMTQGLLDLKRLNWNLRRFRAGHRKDQTPYGLLASGFPSRASGSSSSSPRRNRGKDCPRRRMRLRWCRLSFLDVSNPFDRNSSSHSSDRQAKMALLLGWRSP